MLLFHFLVLGCLGCCFTAADKQLYFSNKAPFIKFDSKDSEVEIELGVSVPVVKIPLVPEEGRKESGIRISAPGLVVAGIILSATFLFVPLLFQHKIHKNFRSDGSLLKSIEREIRDFPHYSPCAESLLCWTAKASKEGKAGIIGNWINGFVGYPNREARTRLREEISELSVDEKFRIEVPEMKISETSRIRFVCGRKTRGDGVAFSDWLPEKMAIPHCRSTDVNKTQFTICYYREK